jgi:hypothetical protein
LRGRYEARSSAFLPGMLGPWTASGRLVIRPSLGIDLLACAVTGTDAEFRGAFLNGVSGRHFDIGHSASSSLFWRHALGHKEHIPAVHTKIVMPSLAAVRGTWNVLAVAGSSFNDGQIKITTGHV